MGSTEGHWNNCEIQIHASSMYGFCLMVINTWFRTHFKHNMWSMPYWPISLWAFEFELSKSYLIFPSVTLDVVIDLIEHLLNLILLVLWYLHHRSPSHNGQRHFKEGAPIILRDIWGLPLHFQEKHSTWKCIEKASAFGIYFVILRCC